MQPFKAYQNKAIDFALDRPGAAIFARPGKGKTRIACEVIKETDLRTLIIAPKFPMLTTWPAEFKKWGYDFDYRILHGKDKKMGSEYVSIINYDALDWLGQQDLSSYSMVVYDELSKLKDPGTTRFKRWRSKVSKFNYRLGLTGTPRGNHLKNLWGQMFCIDGGETLGRTMLNFKKEYFYPSFHNPHVIHPKEGASEDIYKKIAKNALALDFEENEMPPLTHNIIPLQLPREVRALYAQMREDSLVHDTDIVAMNAGVRSAKLRQIAAGSVYDTDRRVVKMHNVKADALRNLCDELQGDPALIFFEFAHDLAAIRSVLGDSVPSLDGHTKTSDMVSIVAQWNAGELPFLAAHPRTAGMGGNMQESGSNIIWYTSPWSLEMLEQGIGRIWRQGKVGGAIAHYLNIVGTKDDEVLENWRTLQDEQNQMFNLLK